MKQQVVEAATVVLQAADSTYIDATLTDSSCNILFIKRSSAKGAGQTRGRSCLRQETMR